MLVHGCSAVGVRSEEKEIAEKRVEEKGKHLKREGERIRQRGREMKEESPKRREGGRKSKRDKMVHALVCVVF